MTVLLSKTMMSSLNKIDLIQTNYLFTDLNTDEHWQKLSQERDIVFRLSKDLLCRVCCKSASTPLSSKLDDFDIMGALRSVTNIAISPDDSLPKYICSDCLESLKISIKFRRMCEINDRKFRNLLNPSGDPILHSYPYSKHDFQLILHEMKKRREVDNKRLAKKRDKREKLVQKKDPKAKEFRCSHCDLLFPNKDTLLSHRREKQCMRRACDICGELVRSIAQHMRHNHKQSITHVCSTCGKDFPSTARLKNHMLVHTNTFNFFCDMCPYKCKYKYYLVMHMRTHTGEKPYKCAHCPATFVNPSNLNKHKLTHQEKQFKCMLCEKAFRTSAALREHHDATHMNLKHTCAYCGRDFCYKSDLRKHEIKNHNRIKRDYIGGEPTYKQVERLQKQEEDNVAMDKWRLQQILVSQPQIQATFIDQQKEFVQTAQPVYFTDVTAIIQQPTLVQQQSVQLALPEMVVKKDDVKMYEVQQGMPYF